MLWKTGGLNIPISIPYTIHLNRIHHKTKKQSPIIPPLFSTHRFTSLKQMQSFFGNWWFDMEIDNINWSFTICSRTPINQASSPSSTPSAASPCRSGTSKVPPAPPSPQRTHQAPHRPGHPILSPRNHGHQRHHRIHHLPAELEGDPRHQTSLPGHDHQECTPLTMQLKKYFTFEVQVLDDKNVRRRFRASNYQSTTRVKPFICTMPMRLDEGWNQIQFNLSDFTRRAYGSNYIETLRVTIHANCRIRRIYFSDRLYSEEELPPEFKLFLPIQKQQWSGLSYISLPISPCFEPSICIRNRSSSITWVRPSACAFPSSHSHTPLIYPHQIAVTPCPWSIHWSWAVFGCTWWLLPWARCVTPRWGNIGWSAPRSETVAVGGWIEWAPLLLPVRRQHADQQWWVCCL